MRWLVFLVILFPSLAGAQSDFESNFIRIEATALPEIEDLSSWKLRTKTTMSFSTKLKTLRMNTQNYRLPVDMAAAMEQQHGYVSPDFDMSKLDAAYRNVGADATYVSDGKTKVKNTVYTDMRNLSYRPAFTPFGYYSRNSVFSIDQGY
ncbi:MAG: hypothetical protein CMC35_06570 [Flavobacteriaceae bacterium]|nr:hypothetical protein [Flavobacteriaceae bacterium]|tara:strand:+ start:3114 stop:3560 length:447 start_codon:yes stop_codon:yes gene_type:complete